MCVSEARTSHSQRMWAEVSSFTPHPLHSGLYQPQLVKVSSQGVVSSKKASHNLGLSPVEGQKFGRETRTGSRD